MRDIRKGFNLPSAARVQLYLKKYNLPRVQKMIKRVGWFGVRVSSAGRGVAVRRVKPVPYPKYYNLNLQGSLPYFFIIGAALVGGGVVGYLFVDTALAGAVLAFMRSGW